MGETRISNRTEAPAQGLGPHVPGTGQEPVPLPAPENALPLDAEPEAALPLDEEPDAEVPEEEPELTPPLLAEPDAELPLVFPETPPSSELVVKAIPPQPARNPFTKMEARNGSKGRIGSMF